MLIKTKFVFYNNKPLRIYIKKKNQLFFKCIKIIEAIIMRKSMKDEEVFLNGFDIRQHVTLILNNCPGIYEGARN